LTLAQNRIEAQKMGARGRQYVETHFDRAVIADKLEKILLQILKEG
jgi:glycosyltransferase involved in cell wall biosynthesis